jgi:prepilin-type N-terminal cleavage/methylation domain-containing protein
VAAGETTLISLDTRPGDSGFTLVEILMVIILIGILVVLSTGTLNSTLNEARFQQTVVKLNQIRNALVGDPDIKSISSRTSFGFLGDVGNVPNASGSSGINQMITRPTVIAAYSISATSRIGSGWNGPYLSAATTGEDPTLDAWGTAIEYDPTAISSYTIISRGADRVAGGSGYNQDITVSIAISSVRVTVQGYVCQNGGPYTAASQVEIHYPDGSGGVTHTLVTSDPDGYFSFSNIPIGVRSISVYTPAKTGATKTIGPSIITVDRPNYLVPCDYVDVGP